MFQQNKGPSSGHKTRQVGSTALSACLLCFVPTTIGCPLKWAFVAATNKTELTVTTRWVVRAIQSI
jgi:hypothetical protein